MTEKLAGTPLSAVLSCKIPVEIAHEHYPPKRSFQNF